MIHDPSILHPERTRLAETSSKTIAGLTFLSKEIHGVNCLKMIMIQGIALLALVTTADEVIKATLNKPLK